MKSLTRSDSLKRAYAEGRHRRNTSEDVKKSWEKRERTFSNETKLKQSIGLKRAALSVDDKRHKNVGNYDALKKYYELNGRFVSVEVRKKISESLKGRNLSDEHCLVISRALKGRKINNRFDATGFKHSKESRKNMSNGQKKIWEDRDVRFSDEVRRNMSISHSDYKNINLARSRIIDVMKRRETVPERKIRNQLENARINFERQVPVNEGEFIFDFKIGDKLFLECDSDYWHGLPQQISRDHKKNEWVKQNGFLLVRVSENDVLSGGFSVLSLLRCI